MAVTAVTAGSWSLIFWTLGNHALGGQHEAGNRSGVLQSRTYDLGGVDNASFQQIFVLVSRGVEAEGALALANAVDDDAAFTAAVLGNPAHWLLDGAADDGDAVLLLLGELQAVQSGLSANQRYTTAGNNALFNSSAGSMQCILNACLLLFHLGLGGCADLDHCNAADQFRFSRPRHLLQGVGEFRRVDGVSFTALVYRNGKRMSACAVRLNGAGALGAGITYSQDVSRIDGNSFNERVSVEADDQSLYLRSMGMVSMYSGSVDREKLSHEGAAELFWGMLIEPLQR